MCAVFASYLINFAFSDRLLNFVAFFLLLCGDSSLAVVLTLLNFFLKNFVLFLNHPETSTVTSPDPTDFLGNITCTLLQFSLKQ